MTKQDLKDFLVYEAEYDKESVDKMNPKELMDAWLTWEGIIGYTNQIIELYGAAHETDSDV